MTFNHEIFLADEMNFGAILAIRTGPPEFSKMLVTKLLNGGSYRQHEGYVRPWPGDPNAIHAVPTEEEFFKVCGVGFVPPGERKC